MKFCPVCQQKYGDEQNFCLDDGTSLRVFSTESEVPTANFKDLNDLPNKPSSPTILAPPPNNFSQNRETVTVVSPQIKSLDSPPPKKSNSWLVALLSIFGTLGVVGLIGVAWLWLGNNQTSNQVSSNSSINPNQVSPTVAKSNISSTSNQTENSKSDKKSSNSGTNIAQNAIATPPISNKTDNVSVNSSPAPSENSTADVQVKLTTLSKTSTYPYPNGSINIQILGGRILTGVTNNAGVASFKDVPCGKPLRISVSCEDGHGVFARNLKCGANASWSYQVDCFVPGKTGGCVIEQVK